MAKRISIISTNCRRCGKSISTLNRSITGADALKAKLDKICQDCITPDEEREILNGQAAAILTKANALPA
jgi:hypothetical protein